MGTGGTHDVEVVGAHVGDHGNRGVHDLVLRQRLDLRLERHALQHHAVRLFLEGPTGDVDLFADVGFAHPGDLVFHPVHVEVARVSPGRLPDDAVSRMVERAVDEPGDRGLSPRPVHMDARGQVRKAHLVTVVFHGPPGDQKCDENHKSQHASQLSGSLPVDAPGFT